MSGNGTGLGQRPERMLDVLTPESCGGCGLITDRWIKENPDQKWIRIDIHPGIALFCCPKCNMAMFNPNLQANNARMVKWQKEDNEQRIRVASSIIDPKTNKIVDLGRV